MYLPAHYANPDAQTLHALMRAHPLATLIHQGTDGPDADHIPLELDADDGPHGCLVGHVARANPVWQRAQGQAVLAVFQGPQAYISPNHYPSKALHHRVVPTWNYAVVHAHGVLQAEDDPTWVLALVTRLTQRHETASVKPWAVSDAPADHIQKLLGAIIGIRIPLTRLVGKWKISQNMGPADRLGAAAGVEQAASRAATAWAQPQLAVARLMRDHDSPSSAADKEPS